MKRLTDCRMRLTLIGFVVSGFLSMVSVCSAWEYVWTQKADMPTPRWTQTSAVVNGKIYVIGGLTSESEPDWRPLSTVEEYDPATNTWTRKADMLTVRCDMLGSSAVVNDKIYVIGGYSDGDAWGGTNVEEYDPVIDTWTRKADMPTRRWSLATCAVDGKIYAIGGAPSSYTGLNIVEQYDPITDTWTRKRDLPTGLWGLCTKVVNGKIYAFGGRPGATAVPNTYEYDPATDTWSRKANMPLATSQMASAVLGDKIIVIGGWHISSRFPYATMQMYDTETDTWTIEDDAPFLRAVVTGEVVNNRIYVIGGTDRPHPCPALSTVYELTINPPPPDFNGDGVIDSTDVCIMVEHWGTDYSLCDIAPPPFGDGIVDVEDLKVLSEYLFEEVDDPTLVAHWPLDEAEGMAVADGAGGNDGYALGDPVWLHDGGQVNGALHLDGVDDYVVTGAAPNPEGNAYSVLAWIKGGAPGQVVLSQMGKADWLCADPAAGTLMTELTMAGRNGCSLGSDAIITDGNWHRIGFVWDGSYRRLYVDGVIVAEDAHDSLDISSNGLYFGTGKVMESGTFFSGLIDDIRIYNRVVSP